MNFYRLDHGFIKVNISQEPEPSLFKKIQGFLFFFLLSLGAFWWFGLDLSQLVFQVKSNASAIEFHKGAFFCLGIGIGFGTLVFGILFKHPVSSKVIKIFNVTAFFGIFIMILLPQVVHYSLENILEKRGYMICDLDSVQWRMYRTFYYVSNVDACINLKEIRADFLSKPLFDRFND